MLRIILILLIGVAAICFVVISTNVSAGPKYDKLTETKIELEEGLDSDFHLIGSKITEKDKVCVIGDSGLNSEGRVNVFKALAKENCTELRVTGDIIYEDGLEGDLQNKNKQFKDHVVYLKKLGVPVYIVLGNHDDYGDEDMMITLSNKNGINYPNHFYTEQRGNICFVSIFSDPTGAKELVVNGISQRDWLKKQIRKLRPNCNYMIGIAHHLYKTNGTHRPDEKIGKEFYEDYIVGKLDMFLSGHDHHLEDVGDYKGTRFLISGAAAKRRGLLGEDKWHKKSKWAIGNTYGYMTLQFSNDCSDPETCEAEYKFYIVDDEGDATMEHSNIVRP